MIIKHMCKLVCILPASYQKCAQVVETHRPAATVITPRWYQQPHVHACFRSVEACVHVGTKNFMFRFTYTRTYTHTHTGTHTHTHTRTHTHTHIHTHIWAHAQYQVGSCLVLLLLTPPPREQTHVPLPLLPPPADLIKICYLR